MSSHQLAIAKASFSAALLRPEPTPITRTEIANFDDLLLRVILECSSANVQNCKRWIISNVTYSISRSATFVRYLVALSKSFTPLAKPLLQQDHGRWPSIKRRRVHLLYLVNDVLHHDAAQRRNPSISANLQPLLVDLFTAAAAFRDCPKHIKKIFDLIDVWETNQYYTKIYLDNLREAAQGASDTNKILVADAIPGGVPESDKNVLILKKVPFIMPALHGDMGTPWYDLPAGNIMPHIVPNSTRPINPEVLRPLRFNPGPAEKDLARAVQTLIEDVGEIYKDVDDRILGHTNDWDIDDLGQIIIPGGGAEETGGAEAYYGWSKQFCENMRRRRSDARHSDERGRGMKRSPSRTSDHSSLSDSQDVGAKHRRQSNSRSPRLFGRNRSWSRDYLQDEPYGTRSRSISENGNGRSERRDWTSHLPRKSSRSRSPAEFMMRQYPKTFHQSTADGPELMIATANSGVPSSRALDMQNPLSKFPPFIPGSLNQPDFVYFPPPPPPPPGFLGPWPPPPPPLAFGQQHQQDGWQPSAGLAHFAAASNLQQQFPYHGNQNHGQSKPRDSPAVLTDETTFQSWNRQHKQQQTYEHPGQNSRRIGP